MSIIVYGPQGCGKTRNAEELEDHYNMDEICDDVFDPYPFTDRQRLEFKEGRVLFLTCTGPDMTYSHDRRVIGFSDAMTDMAIQKAKK